VSAEEAMSHVDPKRPTVMPAYPLGSPPGAEMLDPQDDPQTAHLPPAPPPTAQPEYAYAGPRAEGDEEWTVLPETDATRPVSRR
jgi:hypothetical protein